LFKNPKELFESQVNDVILRSSSGEESTILKALAIQLGMPPNNRDFQDLYHVLGLEGFVRVMSLFEGRSIRFPSRKNVNDMILTALLFHYREIEGMSWSEIKERVPFDFSPISYSTKIKKMNSYMISQLEEALGGKDEK
jgi:hypothetical protein